jgi:beta-galactosidase
MTEFAVTSEGFRLDGSPFRVLCGALHYFRVHPGQWAQRLRLLRGMGCNAVETYVPWNFHERGPGDFAFEGWRDFETFLRAASAAGLYAIVRPGPYVCAEWDAGGLPHWLGVAPGTGVRCGDERFLVAVDRWFDELIPRIAAHQVHRGGPVIMVQVENEYGVFGSDAEYLWHLAEGLRRRGITVPLFTSDPPMRAALSAGSVPGLLTTVNTGGNAAEAFRLLRERQADGPLLCAEFWVGWFDHWGQGWHVTREPAEVAGELDALLAAGGSVNIYMACGGTNFGLWAGADQPGEQGGYGPITTSYDYDAPIDERGATTAKYWAFREVLGRYTELPPAPEPEAPPTVPAGTIPLPERLPLGDALEVLTARKTTGPHPATFEALGQRSGFALYRTRLVGPCPASAVRIPGLADRAQVYLDGTEVAVLERGALDGVDLEVPKEGARLDVLVESMGRVHHGPALGERKGAPGGVLWGGRYLHGWESFSLPLDSVAGLRWEQGATSAGPAFHRGHLEVGEPADTFLALPNWRKGIVWVNDFCLGRYSGRGPQRTLYCPAPVLRAGANEIVVLELHEPGAAVELRAEPELD